MYKRKYENKYKYKKLNPDKKQITAHRSCCKLSLTNSIGNNLIIFAEMSSSKNKILHSSSTGIFVKYVCQ